MNTKTKNLLTLIFGGLAALSILIFFLMSWRDIKPGWEGFLFKPYSGGIDTSYTLGEGTHFIAPWNKLISYPTLQESKQYKSEVMDENGTPIEVVVSVNFSVQKSKSSKLHLQHGLSYVKFIDDKSFGAIKDVVGRYTYDELFSTKRESLESEIEEILTHDFIGNWVVLHYVEIADVNLPKQISEEIVQKETQKQRNNTSELKKTEEKNLADAKIEKSRGDSSLVISAYFQSEAIKLQSQQIEKSPGYIDYIKWQGYREGQGSPYGTHNVYGSGVNVLKQID